MKAFTSRKTEIWSVDESGPELIYPEANAGHPLLRRGMRGLHAWTWHQCEDARPLAKATRKTVSPPYAGLR